MTKYAKVNRHVQAYITHGILDDNAKVSENMKIVEAAIKVGGNVKLVNEQIKGMNYLLTSLKIKRCMTG